jgi:lysophospholipase L1-like esterase
MTNLQKFDKNFIPPEIPKDVEMEFYNVKFAPFKIFGVFVEGDHYTRLPESVADAVGSEGVFVMRKQTAGGRVSFATNSKYVALRTTMHEVNKKMDFTTVGSAGYDLFCENDFVGIFYPPYNYDSGYCAARVFPDGKMRNFILNMPPYSAPAEIEIGIEKGATLTSYEPYGSEKPIVFYGSSITQGAFASRPGNTYEAKISRDLNIDYINLGFSGNARGEVAMAEYIASLPMSVFVMDYDHNSNANELTERHERFYKIIREKNPTLPIIFVSAPDVWFPSQNLLREIAKKRPIVMQTYANAMANGDTNVYFVDGSSFYQFVDKDFATTDGCHPNDLGFYLMAEGIKPYIKQALGKKK